MVSGVLLKYPFSFAQCAARAMNVSGDSASFNNAAAGVGQFWCSFGASAARAANVSATPLPFTWPGLPWSPSIARGVGHCFSPLVDKVTTSPSPCKKPDALPLVGRAGIGSAVSDPPSIVPRVGQVSEDDSEIPATVAGKGAADVFPPDERRLALAGDPDLVPPEDGLGSVEAGALSCGGHVLAGTAADDDVHKSHKSTCVPTCDVVGKYLLPVMFKDRAAVAVDLHATH